MSILRATHYPFIAEGKITSAAQLLGKLRYAMTGNSDPKVGGLLVTERCCVCPTLKFDSQGVEKV